MRIVRFVTATAVLAALSFAPVASAQSNPMVQHYRAYVAALDRGDLATATTEAEAALAASEARDGDGGRTAVLSLNLATVHMLSDRPEQAQIAAQRALDLARAGVQGVDPVLAEIIVVRSMLSSNGAEDAAARLGTLLASPGASTLSDAEMYTAAAQLGNWGFSNDDFDMAKTAWALAGLHAEGSAFGETYGFGRARTSEAIAIILGELGGRGARRIAQEEGNAAHALLSDAVRALYPLSQIESPSLELTLAQQTYSEARAWLMALESKLHGDGRRVPDAPEEAQGDADGFSEVGPVDLTRPRCMMRLIAQPLPQYPRTTQIAAVMLFFRINETGEIASHQIVARVGSEQFAESIERVVGRWRVERIEENSAPNCRMESNLLQSVRFIMPD